jgi:hypothetical protein
VVKASEPILLPQDIFPELKIAGASADKTFATPDEALNSYGKDLELATQQLKEYTASGKPLDAISYWRKAANSGLKVYQFAGL